jgi:hypothetical protein
MAENFDAPDLAEFNSDVWASGYGWIALNEIYPTVERAPGKLVLGARSV